MALSGCCADIRSTYLANTGVAGLEVADVILLIGTNPRVDRRSLDFSAFEPLEGDAQPQPFSWSTPSGAVQNKVLCHIVNTNDALHQSIRQALGSRNSP